MRSKSAKKKVNSSRRKSFSSSPDPGSKRRFSVTSSKGQGRRVRSSSLTSRPASLSKMGSFGSRSTLGSVIRFPRRKSMRSSANALARRLSRQSLRSKDQPDVSVSDDATAMTSSSDEENGFSWLHSTNEIFARPWRTFGSERVIESVQPMSRSRIKLCLKRPRKFFGQPYHFSAFNGSKEQPLYHELPPSQQRGESVEMLELEAGVQASKQFSQNGTQTEVHEIRNSAMKSEPNFLESEVSVIGDIKDAVAQSTRQSTTRRQKNNVVSSDPSRQSAYDNSMTSSTASETVHALSKLKRQLRRCVPKITEVFLENDIFDITRNDYKDLEPISWHRPTDDSKFKEYQSYTTKETKNRNCTQIEFHPTLRAIFAVTYGERADFDDRVNKRSTVNESEPRFVLLWHLQEPLQPFLKLIAPEEVTRIAFNPAVDWLLAGGLTDGKLVLWDFSPHMKNLTNRRREARKVNSLNTLDGFVDESAVQTPTVNTAAQSTLGHHHFITGLSWIKDPLPIKGRTRVYNNKGTEFSEYYQLVSTAAEPEILFWDMRPPSDFVWPEKSANPLRPATSFHYLTTNQWQPFYQLKVSDSDPDLEEFVEKQPGPDKKDKPQEYFHIVNSFGRLSDSYQFTEQVPEETQDLKRQDSAMSQSVETGALQPAPPDTYQSSVLTPVQSFDVIDLPGNEGAIEGTSLEQPTAAGGSRSKSLDKGAVTIESAYFVLGTEEGKLVKCNLSPDNNDTEIDGFATVKPKEETKAQWAPIKAIRISPFVDDTILTLGEWSFALWKLDFAKALLRSKNHSVRLTDVCWSPTCCSAFYVTRGDGYLEAWDLLQKSHEPVSTQKVSDQRLCSVSVKTFSTAYNFVCCGDSSGTAFMLLRPQIIKSSSEAEIRAMTSYLEREKQHHVYVEQKQVQREKDKPKMSAIGKYSVPSVESHSSREEVEEEERKVLKEAYNQYLELERELRKKLGLSRKKYTDSKGNRVTFEANDSKNGSSESSTSFSKVASDFSFVNSY